MVRHSAFAILSVCFHFSVFAQDALPDYTPPEGEKLNFDKKFSPSSTDASAIFEINPLLLIRRGLGLETEFKLKPQLSLGADFLGFETTVWDENRVTAQLSYFGVEPKVRYYPLEALEGVFLGAKLALGTYSYKIKASGVSPNLSWSKETFTLAPIVQVGYRVTAFSGFTFAGYIGGGFNLKNPKADHGDLAPGDQLKAQSRINDTLNRFRPEFGLAFGLAI